MAAEYFSRDDGGHGKAAEHVIEVPPSFCAVLALALVIETVAFVDVIALVVAPDDEKVFGEFYFEGHQQQ